MKVVVDPAIIRLFQSFMDFISQGIRNIRNIIEAATKHYPEIRAIAERREMRSKQIIRLAYRKKKSQARKKRRRKVKIGVHHI